jgi:hypothetical protein
MQRMSDERVAVDDEEEAEVNSMFNAPDIEREVPRHSSNSNGKAAGTAPMQKRSAGDDATTVAHDAGRKSDTEDEPAACRIA